jgi:plasmid stability protein
MIRTITVTLSEDVYAQLAARAQTAIRSVEDVVRETLTRSLRPAPEPDLSPAIQAELNAMEHLSDEALWAIARSTANDDKVALYDVLIERQNAHTLTLEGRHLLTQLRDEADALMLRKAHAYALLQGRGYTLPSLDELHAQTP